MSEPYIDMTPFGFSGPCRECSSAWVYRRLRDELGPAQYYYHCRDCRAEWVTPTEAQLARGERIEESGARALRARERDEAEARTVAQECFGPCRTEPWSPLHTVTGDIQLATYDDPLGAGWTRIPDSRFAWRRLTGLDAFGPEQSVLIVKPPVEPQLFGQ